VNSSLKTLLIFQAKTFVSWLAETLRQSRTRTSFLSSSSKSSTSIQKLPDVNLTKVELTLASIVSGKFSFVIFNLEF
jgi:hypothetical protein